MPEAALPVAKRAARAPKGGAPAEPGQQEPERAPHAGSLPSNPWAIPAEFGGNPVSTPPPSGNRSIAHSALADRLSVHPSALKTWAQSPAGVLLPIQFKLAIGAVNDPLEAEADRVAELVTREQPPAITTPIPLGRAQANGQNSLAQRKCACGADTGGESLCPECKAKKLQRSVARPVKPADSRTAPPIVRQVLRSPGQALDGATRAFFEPRFGRSFAGVRIHSGPEAAASARAVNARAYTVGQHLVFGEGEFNPAAHSGRKLLAHELTHTIHQLEGQAATSAKLVQRTPKKDDDTIDVDLVAVDPEEAERLKKEGIDLPKVSQETYQKLEKAPPSPPATPAAVPGGFQSAAANLAPCPAAPEATVIPDTCAIATPVAGSAPPAKEDATLPALNETPFGGDSKVETFATQMADCHAARVVQQEVNKRYKAAVESAKKSATAEAKTDTDTAIADAVAAVDPKDAKARAAAKKQATTDAKKAADKKIADAQAAVQKQDPDAVKADLAATFKTELQEDYLATMRAAVGRFGPGWLAAMKAAQEKERARLTKEKNAKPKVAKGETPPPTRPPEEIAAEIEAEMVAVRCKQQTWALNQIERVKRGWMVGRREKLDFDTVPQNVAGLKDFDPGRTVAESDRVPIPGHSAPVFKPPPENENEKQKAAREKKEAQAIKNYKEAFVAPEVAGFLTQLRAIAPNFAADSYGGHGGGSWAGAGFSVDLTLTGKDGQLDERGFYKHDSAVQFLLNLNQVVTALGGQWRVLYNDFGVAEEVNHATGKSNVVYMGNNPGGKLNWHGPAPMVLHFHLDIQLPPPKPDAPKAEGTTPPAAAPPK
jgi:hypothetical protein